VKKCVLSAPSDLDLMGVLARDGKCPASLCTIVNKRASDYFVEARFPEAGSYRCALPGNAELRRIGRPGGSSRRAFVTTGGAEGRAILGLL
jgi:hypothetical protein